MFNGKTMRRYAAIIFLLGATSVTGSAQAHEDPIITITNAAIAKYVHPSCKRPKGPTTATHATSATKPGHILAPAAVGEVKQQCGLLALDFEEPSFILRFVKSFCRHHRENKQPRSKCNRKYLEAFDAKLEARYAFANPDFISKECRKHPDGCMDVRHFEGWMLNSHNLEIHKNALRQIEVIRKLEGELWGAEKRQQHAHAPETAEDRLRRKEEATARRASLRAALRTLRAHRSKNRRLLGTK